MIRFRLGGVPILSSESNIYLPVFEPFVSSALGVKIPVETKAVPYLIASDIRSIQFTRKGVYGICRSSP